MTGAAPTPSPGSANPETILVTYLATFATPRSKGAAILLFYGSPLALSAAVYSFATANTQMDWSTQALSIFSVFLGLLISVQMSVFAIYNRFRVAAHDEFKIDDEADIDIISTELKRMNSLISYLNLISVIAMAACIVMAVASAQTIIQEAVVVFFYAHFLLNALLLLKRGHVLFQKGFG